jgi:xanthine dehydrogenase YagS FAD-binding subunit
MLPNFKYVKAGTLKEAIDRLASPGARLLAGGTDLLGCLRDRAFPAETVVSISGLAELRGIEETPGGGLRIGALTTVADVAASPLVRGKYPVLAQAAAEVATPQLRSQGTIGGNLCQKPRCWYYRGEFHCLRKGGDLCFASDGRNEYHCIFGGRGCFIVHPSDTAPALIALGAEVRATGPDGARAIPLEKLHVPPGVDSRRETSLAPAEILTEVLIPPPPPGLRGSYRKMKVRRAWDFALVGVALSIAVDEKGAVREARAAFSGVAPVPWRSPATEAALAGRPLDAEAAKRAGIAAVEGARPLEKNGYKVPLLRGVVEASVAALAVTR